MWDIECLNASTIRDGNVEFEWRHKQQSFDDDREGKGEHIELSEIKLAILIAGELSGISTKSRAMLER